MTESTSPEHKATQGPWRAELVAGMSAHGTNCVAFIVSDKTNVADVCDSYDISTEEAIANAHLLAAAPDLLEALEVMLAAYIEAIASVCDEPQEGQGPIGKARAAIARASSSIANGDGK